MLWFFDLISDVFSCLDKSYIFFQKYLSLKDAFRGQFALKLMKLKLHVSSLISFPVPTPWEGPQQWVSIIIWFRKVAKAWSLSRNWLRCLCSFVHKFVFIVFRNTLRSTYVSSGNSILWIKNKNKNWGSEKFRNLSVNDYTVVEWKWSSTSDF